MTNYDRLKDAPWMVSNIKDESIFILGMGGIGSNTFYNLYKTIPCKYYIQDMDIVESYNVDTQFFDREDIGKLKVSAALYKINEFNDKLLVFNDYTKYENFYAPISIAALDNMKTRRELFEVWKKEESRELLIDARLRADFYEIYFVQKGMEDKYESTLFDDDRVQDAPCTYKATTYFGMLCGARITQGIAAYLSNKYAKDEFKDTFILPFKVSEFGPLFYYNTEDYETINNK